MTLHDRIMNLPTGSEMPHKNPERSIYKTGHRDARHAAAELSLEAEELMAEMAEALVTLLRVDDEWHGSVNSEMAGARNRARAMIENYNTHKESKQ